MPSNRASLALIQYEDGVKTLKVSVQESKVLRQQRLLDRFRGRGGTYVPRDVNPLVDLLLARGVNGESPRRGAEGVARKKEARRTPRKSVKALSISKKKPALARQYTKRMAVPEKKTPKSIHDAETCLPESVAVRRPLPEDQCQAKVATAPNAPPRTKSRTKKVESQPTTELLNNCDKLPDATANSKGKKVSGSKKLDSTSQPAKAVDEYEKPAVKKRKPSSKRERKDTESYPGSDCKDGDSVKREPFKTRLRSSAKSAVTRNYTDEEGRGDTKRPSTHEDVGHQETGGSRLHEQAAAACQTEGKATKNSHQREPQKAPASNANANSLDNDKLLPIAPPTSLHTTPLAKGAAHKAKRATKPKKPSGQPELPSLQVDDANAQPVSKVPSDSDVKKTRARTSSKTKVRKTNVASNDLEASTEGPRETDVVPVVPARRKRSRAAVASESDGQGQAASVNSKSDDLGLSGSNETSEKLERKDLTADVVIPPPRKRRKSVNETKQEPVSDVQGQGSKDLRSPVPPSRKKNTAPKMTTKSKVKAGGPKPAESYCSPLDMYAGAGKKTTASKTKKVKANPPNVFRGRIQTVHHPDCDDEPDPLDFLS